MAISSSRPDKKPAIQSRICHHAVFLLLAKCFAEFRPEKYDFDLYKGFFKLSKFTRF